MSAWLGEQCTHLKDGESDGVIAAVKALPATTDEAREVVRKEAAYLIKRRKQMAYDQYIEAGYPIGSGMVESANKLVVEARLKGSGMHWQRSNVSPMVSVRGLICSGTWEGAWGSLWQTWRQQARSQRWSRHPRPGAPPLPPPRARPREPWTEEPASPYFEDGKPAATHPWKHQDLPHSGARSSRKTAKS